MIPLRELVSRFEGLKVGVAGDMMADHHVHGRPTRLSREAPVVVLQHEREFHLPGGAANCAANLLSLGARVSLFGAVGKDAAGDELRAIFRKRGADVRGLLADPGYRTITKMRILAGDSHRTKQQVIRIDREPPGMDEALQRRLAKAASGRVADAWLAPDYGYGAVGEGTLSALRRRARSSVVVGTSRYALGRMTGLSAVTANEAEALEATGKKDAWVAGKALLQKLKPSKALLVTRGNLGMLLFEPGKPVVEIPASGSSEAVDVTGAGDTVCAVLTLALAAGASPMQAALLANAAAGEVVMRPGAAVLSSEELLSAAERDGGRA